MNTQIAQLFTAYESTNSDYNVQNLGKMVTLFQDYNFRFQDKNVGKKATFTFFDKDNKTLNVVLSTKLDAMYRAGKINAMQLIGCDVVMLDLINPVTKEVIAKNVLRLQAPASGLVSMKALTVQDYVDAIQGFI